MLWPGPDGFPERLEIAIVLSLNADRENICVIESCLELGLNPFAYIWIFQVVKLQEWVGPP